MDVRVVEAGNQPAPFRVDDRRRSSAPVLDVVRAADVDDAITDHGDGHRVGPLRLAGPHSCARDHEIGRKPSGPGAADGERRGKGTRRDRGARTMTHERGGL